MIDLMMVIRMLVMLLEVAFVRIVMLEREVSRRVVVSLVRRVLTRKGGHPFTLVRRCFTEAGASCWLALPLLLLVRHLTRKGGHPFTLVRRCVM